MSVQRSEFEVPRSGADGRAVFLSYASQDADAARRICEALRASGVEVWFDQNELVGGDAWDAKIRKQIAECALFVPIISAATQTRGEGYFRIEWRLAAQRTHAMADDTMFLLPVVIDDTRDADARVPQEFKAVQWTRLALAQSNGLPDAASVDRFCARVAKIVGSNPARLAETGAAPASARPVRDARRPKRRWLIPVSIAVLGTGAIGFWPRWSSYVPATSSASPASAPRLGPKSIAVLPFTNVGANDENDFFVQGLHDDVITSLTKIRDVVVIAGGSMQSYRDPATRDLRKIAADLGVATVLEGSVRRLGAKVHLNVKLIDGHTTAHRWGETFDGSTTDLFELQRALAQEIALALKATLTATERSLLDQRPTRNQPAYDLYLRAHVLGEWLGPASSTVAYNQVIELLEEALTLDPDFALAHAHLSIKHGNMYWFGSVDPSRERFVRAEKALAAAERLAPDAPETHLARGAFAYQCRNDWAQALTHYARAEARMPNDAELLYRIGVSHRRLGHWPEALNYFERSVALNPHELSAVGSLVDTQFFLHRYALARDLAEKYLAMFPGDRRLREFAVRARYTIEGDRAAFVQAYGKVPSKPIDPFGLQIAYERAMYAGDLDAAERALADPRIVVILPGNDVAVEPVSLHRAQIAALQGRRDAAEKWADEALAFLRKQTWSPRQQSYVEMAMALAEACANRTDAAVRDGRAAYARQAKADALEGALAAINLGRVYLLVGRRDDALDALRSAMISACDITPQEIRDDAAWSRLKDEPRFEEILRAVKPL